MVSAPGLHSRWWAYRGEGAYRDGKRLHVSNVTTLSKAMVFTTGTGPSKNAHDQAKIRALLDAARNSRSFGGFWQHMLVAEGAIEPRSIGLRNLGTCAVGIMVEKRRPRRTYAASERFIRAAHQHKRKNSRRSAGDFALKRGIVRARRMKESLSKWPFPQ